MAKEKSLIELQAERQAVQTRHAELNTAREARDSKEYTPEERQELGNLEARLRQSNIDELILRATDNSKMVPHTVPSDKSFSIRSAILAQVDGKYATDETRAYNEAGKAAFAEAGLEQRGGLYIPVEARASSLDYNATGDVGKGKDLIATQFMDILPSLQDRLVLAQAGATILTGLRSNIDIPSFNTMNAGFVDENVEAPDAGGSFSHKKLSPKRLTATFPISKQLLLQDTLGVETFLRSELIRIIAIKLQQALLGNQAGTSIIPAGLFNGTSATVQTLNWPNVVALETLIDSANALDGTLGYLMHTQLYGSSKVTSKTALQQSQVGVPIFLLDGAGTELNGYKVQRTNSVAVSTTGTPPVTSYGIAFGNWADYIIGQWGGLELTVDPYTMATQGALRITVNSYWDAVKRRDASFATAYMNVATPTGLTSKTAPATPKV